MAHLSATPPISPAAGPGEPSIFLGFHIKDGKAYEISYVVPITADGAGIDPNLFNTVKKAECVRQASLLIDQLATTQGCDIEAISIEQSRVTLTSKSGSQRPVDLSEDLTHSAIEQYNYDPNREYDIDTPSKPTLKDTVLVLNNLFIETHPHAATHRREDLERHGVGMSVVEPVAPGTARPISLPTAYREKGKLPPKRHSPPSRAPHQGLPEELLQAMQQHRERGAHRPQKHSSHSPTAHSSSGSQTRRGGRPPVTITTPAAFDSAAAQPPFRTSRDPSSSVEPVSDDEQVDTLSD